MKLSTLASAPVMFTTTALALAGTPDLCGELIVWLFAIQTLMVIASLGSFYLNKFMANIRYADKKDFNWEAPLTDLVWITSIVSMNARVGDVVPLLQPSRANGTTALRCVLGPVSPGVPWAERVPAPGSRGF